MLTAWVYSNAGTDGWKHPTNTQDSTPDCLRFLRWYQIKWAPRREDNLLKISLYGKHLRWDLSQTGARELCRPNTIKQVSDAAQWIWDIVIHIRLTALGTEILDLQLKYKVSPDRANFSLAWFTYYHKRAALVTNGSCLYHLHWDYQQGHLCFIFFPSAIIQVLLVLY